MTIITFLLENIYLYSFYYKNIIYNDNQTLDFPVSLNGYLHKRNKIMAPTPLGS